MEKGIDTIGGRIRFLRKKMGLKQDELAEKLDVRKSTISNYENEVSAPDGVKLAQMAAIFGVSTDYILGTEMGGFLEDPDTYGSPVRNVPLIKTLKKGVVSGNILYYLTVPSYMTGYRRSFAWDCEIDVPGCNVRYGDILIVEETLDLKDGQIMMGLLDKEKTVIGYYFKAIDSLIDYHMHYCSEPIRKPKSYPIKDKKLKIIGRVVSSIVQL